jgi:hypothetical protein
VPKDNGCVELEVRAPKDSKIIIAVIGLLGAMVGGAGVSAPAWLTNPQSTASAQPSVAMADFEELKDRMLKIENAIDGQREQIAVQNIKLDLLIQSSPYIKVKSNTITVTR